MKGLIIGTVLSAAVGLLAPFGLVFQYFRMGFNPSSQGAVFFFVVIVLVNVAVSLIGRRFALPRADLILIYCMLLMAVTVPTWGLMFFLIGTMVYPYYYATPENRFAELFHDLIPTWIAPQDMKAIEYYYEGLPQGAPIPWQPWLEPLANWFALIMAFGFLLICMSSILHRQWSVHERLTYPMLQVPQAMIEEKEGLPGSMAPLFRSRLMWIGFAVPLVYFSFAGLHHFFPAFPNASFFWDNLLWFRNTVRLVFAFSFAWVGFFYLASLEITFSVWFFYLFCKAEEGMFSILGISSTEKLSLYEFSQPADLTHQATGATIVFVLYVLWMARGHLKDVWAKVWSDPGEGIDDSEELLRYRTAVIGFVVSLVFISFWLWRSGVPLFALPPLLAISLIFFILVARATTTAGIATARSPIVPAYFVISGFGASAVGARGLVALDFTFTWQGESRTSPMVAASHGLKMAEQVRGPKSRLFWGMMIALGCSFAGAAFMILTLCYEYGAINLSNINSAGAHGWPNIGPVMVDLPEANFRGWLFKGIGATVSGLLVWAQHRLFWWPLHPLGFALGVGWLTGHIWFSALVSWCLKLFIMHYGGARLFQSLKPFFLGLILGEVSLNGIWGVIYWLSGTEKGTLLSHM